MMPIETDSKIRPEFVRSEPVTEVTDVTVKSRGFHKTLSPVRQMTHVIYSILGSTYFSNSLLINAG